MVHIPNPFLRMYDWRVRSARLLRETGRHDLADEILGISAQSKREWHDKQARKARRRAERRGTFFGRALNILGL